MTTPTEAHLGEALEDLVSTQPFQPDIRSIHRRGRTLRRRSVAARATTGAAVTAVAALVAVTATSAASHHTPSGRTATGDPNHALADLAAYISTNRAPRTGDATLVERTQSYPGRSSVAGFDLYTDSGQYFYGGTKSSLSAAVGSDANQGDGMFAREVAAAEYAVNGSLAVADQRMADAGFANGTPPTQTPAKQALQARAIAQKLAAAGIGDPHPVEITKGGTGIFNADNYIWENSETALQAGAGNPQVRAGVLRILSTLPGITVTRTQSAGQPVLALTASGSPDLPANYSETITINASNGIPVSLVGGTSGAAPRVTVAFQVSRVEVSAVKAGRF